MLLPINPQTTTDNDQLRSGFLVEVFFVFQFHALLREMVFPDDIWLDIYGFVPTSALPRVCHHLGPLLCRLYSNASIDSPRRLEQWTDWFRGYVRVARLEVKRCASSNRGPNWDLLGGMSTLRSLRLLYRNDARYTGQSSAGMGYQLGKLRYLECLQLRFVSRIPGGLEGLENVRRCAALRSLAISVSPNPMGPQPMPWSDARVVTQALSSLTSSDLPLLQVLRLDLQHCGLDANDIGTVSAQGFCRRLTSVTMILDGNQMIGETGGTVLGGAFPDLRHLRLRLNECRIGPEGVQRLLTPSFWDQQRWIESLSVDFSDNPTLGDAGAEVLGQVLGHHCHCAPRLRSLFLGLRCCSIGNQGAYACRDLIRALARSGLTLVIDLSGNIIGDDGAIDFPELEHMLPGEVRTLLDDNPLDQAVYFSAVSFWKRRAAAHRLITSWVAGYASPVGINITKYKLRHEYPTTDHPTTSTKWVVVQQEKCKRRRIGIHP